VPALGKVISVHVQFELDSKDGLRKVIFGLEKDTDDSDDEVTWTIHFQLLERDSKGDDFAQIINLDVAVKTSLKSKAEKVAQSGLTHKQSLHALGPAAQDAKDAAQGTIPHCQAEDTIQKTLTK
jgi:hypothetical protein